MAPARIIIDPAHDFGKNTWHSLEVTRRLAELTATGWPVLLSASRKDFVGETLGADIEDRLAGTLAVTAVSARSTVKWSPRKPIEVGPTRKAQYPTEAMTLTRPAASGGPERLRGG